MIGVTWNMSIKSLAVCPRTNGIYKITNIKNGRFYIGKSSGKKGFRVRWREHRKALRKNTHFCAYLQNSYNLHGEDCFTFEILEIRPQGEDLLDLESEYIVKLRAMCFEDGYNIRNKKCDAKYPRIHRENNPTSKEFELLDPDGNLVKGKNLTLFCEELGVNPAAMWHVVKGDLKSYKGYKSPNPEFHVVKKEYRLLSPEKNLVIFNNMREFAKKIGVERTSIQAVLSGSNSNAKGYHLENPSPENRKHLDKLFSRKLLLNKDLRIIVKFAEILAFSQKYKIPRRALYDFFAGRKGPLTEKHNWETPTEEDVKFYPIIEEEF